MYIKTIYDLIEFAKTHPNYTYTNYEGERIVYDENCRRVSESMRIIEDELLDRNVDYIIIHNHIEDISHMIKYMEKHYV